MIFAKNMANPTSFIRKMLELRVFLVVNLVILFFLALSFGREYLRNASIESQISDLKQQEQQLEGENGKILSLSQSVETQYYLEKEGRLKYGLRKPGESVVVLNDNTSPTSAATTTTSNGSTATPATNDQPVVISNRSRWWDFFFNHDAYQTLKQQYGS